MSLSDWVRNLNPFCTINTKLDSVKDQLNRVELLLIGITKKEKVQLATLTDVLEVVRQQKTVDESMFEFIAGMKAQLLDALSKVGTVTPEMQAQIDTIFSEATDNVKSVSDNLLANTPQEPPAGG